MSDEKIFEIGDRVKTTKKYNKRFGESCKGLIIDVKNMSVPNCTSFCAVISFKDKGKYINFSWLEPAE